MLPLFNIIVLDMNALFLLEAKELFAQRVFVFLLRGLHLAENFIFRKMRPLPFINFSYRMVD